MWIVRYVKGRDKTFFYPTYAYRQKGRAAVERHRRRKYVLSESTMPGSEDKSINSDSISTPTRTAR